MNKRDACVSILLLVLVLGTPATRANVPPLITSFQGVLRDAQDAPLTGAYPVVFRYWSDPSSVDAASYEIGSESHPAVAVDGGLFTVLLGSQPFVPGASGYGGLDIGQMFGDFNQVWLQVEVDGDVLLPRIRFAAAPYALNCTQLQDKGPGEFLRSEGSDNFTGSALYGYAMTFDPGTTLDVGGTFQLGGVTVSSDAAELNKLDGAGPGVTPANLTALTDGSAVDALHHHSGTNAALLDGFDGAQFLRSDTSDSYTAGTLTLAAGTKLRTDGELEVRGPFFPTITFFNNEIVNPTLQWNTHGAGTEDDRFELSRRLNVDGLFHAGPGASGAGSRTYHFLGNYLQGIPTSGDVSDGDDLFVTHDVEVGQTLYVNGLDLRLNVGGPDATQSLYFFEAGSQTGEALRWNDARGSFEFTEDVGIPGRLSVGSFADQTVAYSRFGTGGDVPDSGDITAASDLYVQQDLEIDQTLYLNGTLRMEDDGPDGDQKIYFYENGNPTHENFAWDDTDSRFAITDGLRLLGSIDAHETVAAPVFYNRFGSGNPQVSGELTYVGDMRIDDDLEVGSTLYVGEALVAGDADPATSQMYNSFGDGVGKDSSAIASPNDLYVNGDLEVDGVIDILNIHGPTATVLNLDADNNVRVMIDDDSSGTVNLAEWFHDSSIASSSKLAELQEDGDFRIRGTLSQNVAFDVAESFIAAEPLGPGDLVAADPARPGAVRRTRGEDDPLVLGIVSAHPGLLLGSAPFDEASLGSKWGEEVRAEFVTRRGTLVSEIASRHPELAAEELEPGALESLALELFFERSFAAVALAGRVPVHADASFGAISAGDPLGPSPVPGVAMKVEDGGPIVGLALEDLADGRGDVLVFVLRAGLGSSATQAPAATTSTPVAAKPASSEQVVTIGDDEAAGVGQTERGSGPVAAEQPAVLAATFPVSAPVEPGDVVTFEAGAVRAADVALDPRVLGIVVDSDAPAGYAAVAIAGVVTCKVDASEGGPILPGDLLATSVTGGHATRAGVPLAGTVLAKALEPLAAGTGVIRVLVLAR